VVVAAHRLRFAVDRSIDCHRRQLCGCTIHLYTLLMGRDKILEAILTIAAALLIFYFVLEIEVLLPIALVLMLIGLMSKWLSAKIIWLWFKLAEVLGFVMSKVILSLVFFLFLFPISVLYRLFNKDTLKLRKSQHSTYTDRSHTYKASDLENPW